MNAIVPGGLGALPAVFQNTAKNDDMAAGVTSGFGVMSFRGKAWRLKHRGEETVLMRADGDGPRSSIEVVVVRAAPVISKIFYETGYTEGSTAPPDCWSTNGQVPDPASPKRQCNTCAGCPQNAWGSKITPAGKQGKACADSKRLAIVPLEDIDNEAFGGPLLLRVPAASLGDMAGYSQKMASLGYPYFAVGTRISFDVSAEYPKLDFNAIRVLTEEEANKVAALQSDPRVNRILDEAVELVHHEPDVAAQKAAAFEQAPPDVSAATAPQPAAAAAPVAPVAPAPTMVNAGTAAPVANAPSTDASQVVSPGPVTSEVTPEQLVAKAQAAFGAAPDVAAPAPAPAPAPAAAAPVVDDAAPAAAGDFDNLLDGLLKT